MDTPENFFPEENRMNKETTGDLNIIDSLLEETKKQMMDSDAFGRYAIVRELGRGGMGVVYHVHDQQLDMPLALKVIIQEKQDQDSIKRFLLEAQTTAKLDHPNIVRFYETGDFPNPYFTMEYIEGKNLRDLIKDKKISGEKLVEVMIKICDALDHAHKKGVMHRDIKPANIMVTKDWEPKIMDFGLAKVANYREQLSISGQIVGTISYMPPEQIDGYPEYASDIYSIGASLYEALTNRTMFQGDSDISIMYQILNDYPIPPHELNPDVSPYLEAICLKCLEKNPKSRYSDFAQLKTEFENFRDNKPLIAKKYNKMVKIRHFVAKNKVLCASIAAILLTIIGSSLILAEKNIELGKRNEIITEQKGTLEEQNVTLENQNVTLKNQKQELIKQKDALEIHNGILEKQHAEEVEISHEREALLKALSESLDWIMKHEKYGEVVHEEEFHNPLGGIFASSKGLHAAEEYEFLRSAIFKKHELEGEKELTEKIQKYTTELNENPEDVDSYTERGGAYTEVGKYDLAMDDFHKAVSIQPKDDEAYHKRGKLHYLKQNHDLALQDFNKAIKLNPKSADAHSERGFLYFQKKNYDLALKDFDKAIALDPEHAHTYHRRGLLYQEHEDWGDKHVLQEFNNAIQHHPKHAPSYIQRGLFFYRQKQYKDALNDFNMAISLHSHEAEVYFKRGIIHYKHNRFKEALHDLHKAIFFDSKNAGFFYLRGNIRRLQHHYKRAIKDYTKAIDLGYKDMDVLVNRGRAYYHIREADKANEDWGKALEYYNSQITEKPQEIENYITRGRLYYHQGNYQDAIADWEKAISLGGNKKVLEDRIAKAREKMSQ